MIIKTTCIALAIGGCALPAIEDSTDDEIQGGQLETGFPAVGMYSTDAGFCSGTLITPSLVLTAKHCLGTNPRFLTGTSSLNFITHTVDQQIQHSSKDLLLAHLATPILNIALIPINTDVLPAVGTTCTGVGFGQHLESDGTTTSGTKRSCTEKITSADSTTIAVTMVSGIADHGDSGGPLLCGGTIAGVVHNHTDGNFPQHVNENYATIDKTWIQSRVGFRPAPADYDGDHRMDIAGKDADGNWYVDLAANGFGTWDILRAGYGNSTVVPVPADYDGDGKADFSVKGPDGTWFVDYASSPQDGWNVIRHGYGDATAVPVPADYDGDGKADFSVKGPDGTWFVDYASSPQDGWNVIRGGYGDATAIPVPADYDGDGKADFSVKGPDGTWFVDYASSPQDGWNVIRGGYGNSTAIPVPADYDGDRKADFSVKDAGGNWYIDYASSPQDGWNVIRSGYGDSTVTPVPGDYDGDRKADFAIYVNGFWLIDFAADGFGAWNRTVVLP